jgi:hypothetical protein
MIRSRQPYRVPGGPAARSFGVREGFIPSTARCRRRAFSGQVVEAAVPQRVLCATRFFSLLRLTQRVRSPLQRSRCKRFVLNFRLRVTREKLY